MTDLITPSSEELDIELWETWWNVQRSIRYHSYRQAFFESYSRLVSGLNILLSTAAWATIFKQVESQGSTFAAVLMLSLALINVVDLVYGTAKRGWHHRELRNKFIELEKKYLAGRENEKVSKSEYKLIRSDILSIEVEEPPIYRALDIYCHNEMVKAYISDPAMQKSQHVKQNIFVWLLRNYLRTL